MASFGENLKKARELREISLREISDGTKIAVRYLEAIEQDRFESLPGGLFNKGFIRAYAAHIGLDSEATIAGYLEALERSATGEPRVPTPAGIHRPAEIPERRAVSNDPIFVPPPPNGEDTASSPPRSSPLGRIVLLVVAAAVLFAVLVSWRYLGADGRSAAAPQEPHPSATSPESTPRLPVESSSGPSPLATIAASGRPAAGPFETRTPPPSASLATTGFRLPADRRIMDLRVEARARTWVRILCDEEERVNRRMRRGETKTMQCGEQIRISATNGSALALTINGSACRPLAEPGSRIFGYVIRTEDYPSLCQPEERSAGASP